MRRMGLVQGALSTGACSCVKHKLGGVLGGGTDLFSLTTETPTCFRARCCIAMCGWGASEPESALIYTLDLQ